MSNLIIGESSDLFDPDTGNWVGVVDRRGREQLLATALGSTINASASKASGPNAAILRKHGDTIALPSDDYVNQLTILHGRSNSVGNYGWPLFPLARVSTRVMMMGDSVRSYDADEAFFTAPGTYPWVQQGTATFNAMEITAEAGGYQRQPATTEETLTWAPTLGAQGECSLYAGLNNFAVTWEATSTTVRYFTGAVTGVGGKQLDELVPGASPNRWTRVTDCLALHKSLATAGTGLPAAQTTQLLDTVYIGGENDNRTYSSYYSLLGQLHQGFKDAATATYSQAKPPALFLGIVAGPWIPSLASGLASCNAAADYALATPGAYLFATSIGMPDRSTTASDKGHLDYNAHRMMGEQLAKVRRHVLIDGRQWHACQPMQIEREGSTSLLVHVFTPYPPLQARPAFQGYNRVAWPDLGFTVEDADGSVPIASAAVFGTASVRLTLARPLSGTDSQVLVSYADESHLGVGNLCDSDPSEAANVYTWADTGAVAQANLVDLLDKPFPLFNWCIPFRRAVGYDVRATIDPPAASVSEAADTTITSLNDAKLAPYLLHLWDADDASQFSLAGASVNTWTSTGGAVLTGGTTKPTRSTTLGPTGGAAVENGGAGYFETTTLGTIPTGTDGCEVLVICRQDAALADTNIRTILGYGAAGTHTQRLLRRTVSGTEQRFQVHDGTDGVNDRATVPFEGWHAVLARFNAGTLSGAIDGNTLSEGTKTAAFNTSTTRLRVFAGAQTAVGNLWLGAVSKILVLQPMPPTIRRALMAYANTLI